jgi:ubiquinone/menaquinone biosynthesis C-methylase UbiE
MNKEHTQKSCSCDSSQNVKNEIPENVNQVTDACCDEATCDMFDFMSDYVGLKILHPGGKNGTKQLLEALRLKKGMKVLDIACGKGRNSVDMAKTYGCMVVGIDILENSIEEARKYAKKHNIEHQVSFMKADAENLPFPDNEFDITIAQAMLILVNNKSKVVREALRVLKPGGKSGWTELSWKSQPDKEFSNRASREICAKCIANVVTFDEWERLFTESDFLNIQVAQYNMDYRGFFRMIQDEGFLNSLNVMYRYMTRPRIRNRMKRLNTFFKTYPEYIGYGIYTGTKPD